MTDLKAIRERAEKAAAGPWVCDESGWPVRFPVEGQGHIPYWSEGMDDSSENPYRPHIVSFPTLDFIAHAREDIPMLCDELAEARGVVAELWGRLTKAEVDVMPEESKQRVYLHLDRILKGGNQ